MNDKLKFILLALILPLILIILSLAANILLLLILGVTWMGLCLLVFHPLDEE